MNCVKGPVDLALDLTSSLVNCSVLRREGRKEPERQDGVKERRSVQGEHLLVLSHHMSLISKKTSGMC